MLRSQVNTTLSLIVFGILSNLNAKAQSDYEDPKPILNFFLCELLVPYFKIYIIMYPLTLSTTLLNPQDKFSSGFIPQCLS